ncbi:hypothetical protein CRX42_00650 [Pseudomonas jessenii]|uniref:Uncharacterized protein n=1 Tax=Pseudomonas jessenii TaxID=77298 RepID=A0A2W0F6B3_PSEJE|nr:hypothetical protein [Pseudomonas jessenii]PYY72488.1 hypothetical protein CRX42_00650 [Pseudomonas jessenii]
MNRLALRVVIIGASVVSSQAALAIQVTENLDLGGAVRTRFDYDPDRDIKKFNFDTFFLTAKYNSDTWIGAAKYRFYGKAYPYQYTDSVGDISFAEYAWVGYKFDEDKQVQVGLNQVPFGNQPYFGSTFAESLGYVLGLEDLSLVGAKYVQQSGDWNFQAGYYIRPAWQGKGTSEGGITYSNVVSSQDPYVENGSDNRERNTIAVRLARKMDIGGWDSEVGISGYTGTLKNNDTDDEGRRNALAVHYSGKNGPWGMRFLAARQAMSPRNPGSDETVTFGGYDSTFNVASRGNLYVADISYDILGNYVFSYVNGIKLYADYSAYDKSADDFKDSQRVILGGSFFVGNHILVATEWMHGKNDPYVGGSSYTQSLAAGGSDQWENQLNINIGYYF